MEKIRIPNLATYLPIAPSDLLVAAPLAARVLFRASPMGRAVQTAAIGLYAGSAVIDWAARGDVKWMDFAQELGCDPLSPPVPEEDERRADIENLVAQLNADYLVMDVPRKELAERVDRALTDYIATITGQRLETSTRIREFMAARMFFPFALGATDPFTGDVALFRRTGVFEPHVIAHEFAHRKGYMKEVHAQILAYLSLIASEDPVLVQSARAERLDRNLWVLVDRNVERYGDILQKLGLRNELLEAFDRRSGRSRGPQGGLTQVMKKAYDARMKMTGQNGLSDYDEGFTNCLLAMERAA